MNTEDIFYSSIKKINRRFRARASGVPRLRITTTPTRMNVDAHERILQYYTVVRCNVRILGAALNLVRVYTDV